VIFSSPLTTKYHPRTLHTPTHTHTHTHHTYSLFHPSIHLLDGLIQSPGFIRIAPLRFPFPLNIWLSHPFQSQNRFHSTWQQSIKHPFIDTHQHLLPTFIATRNASLVILYIAYAHLRVADICEHQNIYGAPVLLNSRRL